MFSLLVCSSQAPQPIPTMNLSVTSDYLAAMVSGALSAVQYGPRRPEILSRSFKKTSFAPAEIKTGGIENT